MIENKYSLTIREAVFVLPKRIWNRDVTDEVDADIVSKHPL